MPTLRTTRFSPFRLASPILLLGVAGCSSGQPREAGPAMTASPALTSIPSNEPMGPLVADRPEVGPKFPNPESDRIDYNATTRTLTLYDPPSESQWVVLLPGRKYPIPAGPSHRLPVGVDPDRTFVYLVKAGGRHSAAVSLRQIQDARETQASAIR